MGIFDRKHGFHPAVEVAGHPIGTGTEEFSAASEKEDAGVFKVAVDNTDDPQIAAVYRWPQAAVMPDVIV